MCECKPGINREYHRSQWWQIRDYSTNHVFHSRRCRAICIHKRSEIIRTNHVRNEISVDVRLAKRGEYLHSANTSFILQKYSTPSIVHAFGFRMILGYYYPMDMYTRL